MSQDPYKNDSKSRMPKFSNKGPGAPGGDGEPPRKGPRFSIYWVYAIIFAVLIGFQFFGGSFSQNNQEISQSDFEKMLKEGDVQKYVIVANRNIVRVKLKDAALPKYQNSKLGKNLKTSDDFHGRFTIASVESF